MAKTWKTIEIYRIVENEIARCAKLYLSGRMIDIGCGTRPFECIISPYISEYVGLDRANPFNKDAKIDLIGSASDIPAADESFDSALSTAALEHLAEPESAIRECYRVLRHNGIAVYTVPFIWHLHAAPWDYYRFTSYGLEHMFTKAGFEVIEVRPLSGFWITWATMFCYYLERFHKKRFLRRVVLPMTGRIVQRISRMLENWDRAEEWSWMYSIVARKR